MEVEHEVDQRPLEPGTGAEVDGEAGAGDLGAALEVEDAEGRAEVPVGLGLEVEVARLADPPLDPVGGLVLALRHGVVGKIGEAGLDLDELWIDPSELRRELLDALFELRHRGDLAPRRRRPRA